jgi:L-arabinose isomerase
MFEEAPYEPTSYRRCNTKSSRSKGFKPDAVTFLKKWLAEGPTHHFALGIGHHAATIKKVADALEIEAVIVN